MSLKSGLTHTERSRLGLVVVANLRGLVCPRCGARGYDPPTYGIIVEATLGNEAGFGARAKVSRLSRDNVGAYIPKDLQAHMGIHAGDTLILQPINRSLILVEVEHSDGETSEGRGQGRTYPSDSVGSTPREVPKSPETV